MKKSALLLPLCAGLVVGAAGAWTVRVLPAHASRVVAPAQSNTTASKSTRRVSSAAMLILPPPLAGAEADAALEAYLTLPALPDKAPAADIQERLARLRALLTLLPTTHFERLLAASVSHGGGAEAQLRRLAFDVWTERDTPAAARWATALVPGEIINASARTRYSSQAALAWAHDDFSSAYAWASALPDAKLGRDLSGRLLAQLASTDPQQALTLAKARDEEFFRATQVGVFQAWAKRDPAAAMRALGPTLLEQRNYDVHSALAKWAARDPSAALDWMIAQPVPSGESHRSVLNNIGWSLVESPEAVRPFIELLARRDDVPNRMGVIQNLFGAWASNDTPGALAWIETMSDIAQRSDLAEKAMDYMDEGRPDEFMKFARLLPPSADREEKISNHFVQWAETDPDAAIAWLAKNNDPGLTAAAQKVESTLVAALAKTDPAAALARWQSLPADSARGEIAVQLATNWARSDPAAATRWFAQLLPADPVKNSGANLSYALQQVASRWARQDPLGLAEWSESLTNNFQREMVAGAFTSNYWSYNHNEPDPPARAPYANQLAQIKDPVIRERALSAHLGQWLRADLKAAQAWIESSDVLSSEAAARLLTRADAN